MADEKIMLPRTGRHVSAWGSGHTCCGEAHDGPCVCECGIMQPYDEPAVSDVMWEWRSRAVPQDT